ncbi:MAG: pyridoxamine 5'-phosphate oxidase family protein [Candidatus Heimdallarchaeota archaeon]|nr:pyridoxamine 5'-phosphate oxidase family protein [Candidatus Heimdallarchaeota archaeon]MBY8994390.1 pyridoxamine 5'-phosphate oxidase family protein [Candidatus Heimdallarchaeota archaeon]
MTEQEFNFEDVKKHLLQMPLVFFSTVEKNQPRVRPMALINCDNEYWLTSRSYEEKMDQVKENAKFEFSFNEQENLKGMIRITGKAYVIEDLKIKEKLSKAIPFFKDYYTEPADPNFGLIKLEIEEVRVLSNRKRYRFDWK